MASDTSYWIKFFTDCGIPAGEATNYAIVFTDNRIQKDMLMDLTKDYLTEMGIKILGDIIAILKHAKEVHSQLAREKALKGTSSRTNSPLPRRSTAASRTVNHYLGKDPEAAPMHLPIVPKISKELSARLGESPSIEKQTSKLIKLNPNRLEEVVPVPKSRRVFPEHEGRYKITMPSGTTAKTQKILQKQQELQKDTNPSVFDRLGADKSSMSPSSTSSVFKRLGGKTPLKRAATSTSIDFDDDEEEKPLEYVGVLKNSPSPSKKTKFTITDKLGARKSLGKITISNPKAVKSPAPNSSLQAKPNTANKLNKQSGIKLTVSNKTKTVTQMKNKVLTDVEPPVTTAGILSMDRPNVHVSARQRLGKKISQNVVSSTTGDDDDQSKPSGIMSRLGTQKVEVSSTSGDTKTKTLTKGKVAMTKRKTQGVFGRLGKQISS